jgi:hypothetical protein
MKLKRVISLGLVLLVSLSNLNLSFGEELKLKLIDENLVQTDNVTSTSAITFYNLNSEENVKSISSVEDLKNISDGGNYILTDDIELSGVWNPISLNGVNLTIDGNGHTISNLYRSSINVRNCGFFSTVRDSKINIKNLNIDITRLKTTYSGGCHIGGLIGYSADSDINIDNCHVTGNIEGVSYQSGDTEVGGFIGNALTYSNSNKLNDLIIRNSSFNGSVIASDTADGLVSYPLVGGLIGSAMIYNIEISGCTAESTLTATAKFNNGDSSVSVGGLIGDCSAEYITFKDCEANSVINTNSVYITPYSGTSVGGLAGDVRNYNSIVVNSCTTEGSMYSYNYRCYSGGLFGSATSSINIVDCVTKMNMSAKTVEENYIGGYVGIFDGKGTIVGGSYIPENKPFGNKSEEQTIKPQVTMPITAIYEVGTATDISNNLVATVTPHLSDKSGTTWESSDPDIVQITDTGYIDGTNSDSLLCNINCKAVGTSIITVTTTDGASASCLVTVTPSKEIDDLESITINEIYPQNKDSVVMRGGTAIRYYQALDTSGEPLSERIINYNLGQGDDTSVETDSNGYFSVKMKDYSEGTYTLQTKLSTGELRQNDILPNSFNLKFTELENSQSSAYSAGISGQIGAGIGAEIGKLKANIIDASLNGELGRSIAIGFNNKDNETDVNLSVKSSAKGGSELSLGPKLKLFKDAVDCGADVSVGASYGENTGYKLTLNDFFNKNNPNYYNNGVLAGMAVLDATQSNSLLSKAIYNQVSNDINNTVDNSLSKVYDQTVKLEEGSEIKISTGDALDKLIAVPKLTLCSQTGSQVYKYSVKAPVDLYTDSDVSASSSITTKITNDFLKLGVAKNISSDQKGNSSNSGNNVEFKVNIGNAYTYEYDGTKSLSTDFKLNGEVNKVKLSVELLDDNSSSLNLSLVDENSYKKLEYVLEDDALDELLNASENLRKITSGEVAYVQSEDFDKFYEILNDVDGYVQVNNYDKSDKIIDIPLSISVGAGVKLGLGADLKAVYDEEYKTEEGVFNKDSVFVTALYDSENYTNKRTIGEFAGVIADGLGYYIGDMFNSVKQSVTEGVTNGIASVKGTVNNWYVRITSFGGNVHGLSLYSIDEDVADTITNVDSLDSTQYDEATAIGENYIVEVLDGDENVISKFDENPVELKFDYSTESIPAMCTVDNLGIYYFNEGLNVYVRLDSTVNTDEKTVSANITKSGQYILGYDITGPDISDIELDYDDTVHTSIIDKMSGIDANKIILKLDDAVILDGTVSEKYYNAYDGYFSYTLQDTLSDGEHTITLIAVDNSGNTTEKTTVVTKGNSNTVSFLYGDADNDGILTASDAAYVLQRVLNSNSELPIANATENWMCCIDVDADDILTASDAAYILQKVLDGNSEFPIEVTNQTA